MYFLKKLFNFYYIKNYKLFICEIDLKFLLTLIKFVIFIFEFYMINIK